MIYWIGAPKKIHLGLMGHPPGCEMLQPFVNDLVGLGIDCILSTLTSEENEALGLNGQSRALENCGIRFVSFAIKEKSVPESLDEIRTLVGQVKKQILSGDRYLIQSRSGTGRSAMIAACLLSDFKFSAKEAYGLIARSRGRPVPDNQTQKLFTEVFALGSGL